MLIAGRHSACQAIGVEPQQRAHSLQLAAGFFNSTIGEDYAKGPKNSSKS